MPNFSHKSTLSGLFFLLALLVPLFIFVQNPYFPQGLTAWSQSILSLDQVFVQFLMCCDIAELLFTLPFM